MSARAWTSAGGDVVVAWDIDQHAYYLTANTGRPIELTLDEMRSLVEFIGNWRPVTEHLARADEAARYFAGTLGVIARGDARIRTAAGGTKQMHREFAATALELHPGYEDEEGS